MSLVLGQEEHPSYNVYSRIRKADATPSITSSDQSKSSTSKEPKSATPRRTESKTMMTAKCLEGLIAQRTTAFAKGASKEQYTLIRNVPRDVFEKLLLRSVRLHYDYESGDLVAKLMPSPEHNEPPAILTDCIRAKTMRMGLDMFKLHPTTTNRYSGAFSAKEGDAGLKPIPERGRKDDWPTLVIECGVSESLPRLRIDAQWWLMNSSGGVRIVIVISFNPTAEEFFLEKWQLGLPSGLNTRTRSNPGHREPCSTASTNISREATTGNFVASSELVIEFAELFLRPPVSPEENLVFTRDDLARWADVVMSGLQ